MKYIDAEKLIAEIERQMNECIGRFGEIHKLPEYRCLKNIRSYITSLQQEQPHFADASKMEQPEVDLEKAFAHEYAIYHLPTFIIASIVNGTELIDFIYKTARHFYELGLNARKEK